MIRLCHHFGKKIKSFAKNDQNVGFMLPTSRDAALGIMSILGTGKTSVNLNYTAPVDTLIGCIDKAELSTTSQHAHSSTSSVARTRTSSTSPKNAR